MQGFLVSLIMREPLRGDFGSTGCWLLAAACCLLLLILAVTHAVSEARHSSLSLCFFSLCHIVYRQRASLLFARRRLVGLAHVK